MSLAFLTNRLIPAMRRSRPSLVVFAVQAVALAVVLRREFPPIGFPLDDAWIHQVVARTFAHTGTLGFEAGKHGAAATSFGWAMLLAINYVALGWPPATYTLFVSALLYFATGQKLLRLLQADGVPEGTALVLVVMFHLSGNYTWFVVSGMEPPLFIALCVFAIDSWLHPDGPRPWRTGILLSALCLTRPEAIVLAGVLLVSKRRVGRRDAIAAMTPVVVTMIVYGGLNLLHTGTVAPLTLAGRRWLWISPHGGMSRLELANLFVLQWCDRLAEFTLGIRSGAALWVVLGLAMFGVSVAMKQRRERLRACAALALAQTLTYAALLPSSGNGGRYQPLLPPLFLLFAALGAITVAEDLSTLVQAPARRRSWTRVFALAMAVPAAACLVRWGDYEAAATRHVNRTEAGMAKIVAVLPPDARVASFDIGALGFFSSRKIWDLGGLVDPTVVPILESARMAAYLKSNRIDYVVLPMGYSEYDPTSVNFEERLGLRRAPGLTLSPISDVFTSREEWTDSCRATWNNTPSQVLFKVSWNDGGDT